MPAARRFPRGLIRALAWLVTAGLLYVLFRRIPFSEVVAAARAAPGWVVPAAVGGTLLIYLCDSFAIWKTFGWFLAKLSFPDVLLVRGATYLLAAINYNVGQGAIVYFVHSVARRPAGGAARGKVDLDRGLRGTGRLRGRRDRQAALAGLASAVRRPPGCGP